MMQRLLGSDVLHVGTFPAAERSAGGGDHKLGDFGVGSGAQGLPDGGMLGIDRLIWFSRTCALNSRCPPTTTDSLLANASWNRP